MKKPINNQILDYLTLHSFEFVVDEDRQIVIFTGLKMVPDNESPSKYSAIPMTEED